VVIIENAPGGSKSCRRFKASTAFEHGLFDHAAQQEHFILQMVNLPVRVSRGIEFPPEISLS
jgi:hypothetical protein